MYEELYEYGLAEGLEPAPDDLPRTAELVCRLLLVTLLRHTGCDAASVQHTRWGSGEWGWSLVTLLRHTGCDAASVQHTRWVSGYGRLWSPCCGTPAVTPPPYSTPGGSVAGDGLRWAGRQPVNSSKNAESSGGLEESL